MKILHIITRLIHGGAQQTVVDSLRHLARAGHDVHLAYGPIYGPEGSLYDQARATGATLHEIRWMRRAVLPVHDWLCYRALRRLIRELKPGLVHTHSSKAGILGRAAAWAEHAPAIVHTVHGLPFHDRQPRLVHDAYILAERFAARRCHRIIGVSRAMLDAFERHRIGDPARFAAAPSGVPVDEFPPAHVPRDVTRKAFGIPDDAPVVGLVARLDPLKGQDDLLDILPDLRRHHSELRLLLVGDGFHRETLERRVEAMGMDDRVIFAGLVPPSQVPSLLAAMDVNTLPSHQEGQGRTLVEALLCECPIVAYDAGGMPEICIDQRTGRLVPTGDRAALAEAILWMLDHPAERAALAAAGRRHAVEHFSIQAMTRQLDAIYSDVIANP